MEFKKIKIILSLCLIQLFVISATANSVDLNPIEDSYISYSDPSINYGSSSFLWTWGEVCVGDYCFGVKTYLKFNLSEIPSSATIISAELKLYLHSTISPTSTVNVFYCPNNNWKELLINWNNAPSFQPTPIDTYYTVAFEGWCSWTVTTAVNNALSARTLTLVFDEEENIAISSFCSKDNYDEDQRPILTIIYSYKTPLGDMNGDGVLNTGDVRWLAIYDTTYGNDPNYRPLYADGDVNCDGFCNLGDVRWLAIYIASNGMDPDYSPLYPSC